MSSAEDVPDRSGLTTEALNKATVELDALPTVQALALIGREDRCIHDAIAGAQQSIANAIDAIAERLARGGRLLYVGAGTSGRLGVLDAVECPPTFQCAPDQVQGILAGGKGAMFQSVEGAEDSGAEAAKELEALGLNENDVVFGITAGGTTPFVHGAIASGQRAGALTVFFACVSDDEVQDKAEISIRVPTGPEVLQGSTRLKAGTATKLVLNSISTLVMARLGKVHGNRMIDVNTNGNVKLLDRGRRLVAELAEVDRAAATLALASAEGHVKLAVLMLRTGQDLGDARNTLQQAGGHLRQALKQQEPSR